MTSKPDAQPFFARAKRTRIASMAVLLVLLCGCLVPGVVIGSFKVFCQDHIDLLPGPPRVMVADGVVLAQIDGGLTALRLSDGRQLWQDTFYPGALLVRNGVVYGFFEQYQGKSTTPDDVISAQRLSDGTLLWKHQPPTHAYAEGVTLLGNDTRIIVAAPFLHPVAVQALDASTGQPVWSVADPGFQAVTIDDTRLYLADAAGLSAHTLADGAVLWHKPLAGAPATVRLTVNGGDVAVAEPSSPYVADDETASVISYAVYQPATGARLWHTEYVHATQVSEQGDVVLFSDGGTVTARQMSDGHTLWHYGTGESLTSLGGSADHQTAYVVANGNSAAFSLIALRVASGKEIWRVQPNLGISVERYLGDFPKPFIILPSSASISAAYIQFQKGIMGVSIPGGKPIWQHSESSAREEEDLQAEDRGVVLESTVGVSNVCPSHIFYGVVALRATDGMVLWRANTP